MNDWQNILIFLQKADPTLRDIKVSFEEEEIAHQKIDSDDFENRTKLLQKKMTVGVDTVHAVFKDGKKQQQVRPLRFLRMNR